VASLCGFWIPCSPWVRLYLQGVFLWKPTRRSSSETLTGWYCTGRFITRVHPQAKAHVRHATKLGNFVAQLCCSSKVACLTSRVSQLLSSSATKLFDRNHLHSSTISLSCLAVNGWFALPYDFADRALKRLTKHLGLLIIMSSSVSLEPCLFGDCCQWKTNSCLSNYVEQQSCATDVGLKISCDLRKPWCFVIE